MQTVAGADRKGNRRWKWVIWEREKRKGARGSKASGILAIPNKLTLNGGSVAWPRTSDASAKALADDATMENSFVRQNKTGGKKIRLLVYSAKVGWAYDKPYTQCHLTAILLIRCNPTGFFYVVDDITYIFYIVLVYIYTYEKYLRV